MFCLAGGSPGPFSAAEEDEKGHGWQVRSTCRQDSRSACASVAAWHPLHTLKLLGFGWVASGRNPGGEGEGRDTPSGTGRRLGGVAAALGLQGAGSVALSHRCLFDLQLTMQAGHISISGCKPSPAHSRRLAPDCMPLLPWPCRRCPLPRPLRPGPPDLCHDGEGASASGPASRWPLVVLLQLQAHSLPGCDTCPHRPPRPTLVPLQTLLSVLAVATCLRAYALHEYARQLTELAVSGAEQLGAGQGIRDVPAMSAHGSARAERAGAEMSLGNRASQL